MTKRKQVLKIGLLCAIIFLAIIFPALVIGKGRLFMIADFNSQQIPFNILCNKSIKNGEYFWNWNTDLGSNFVSSYSFYNIGSPFFWVLMLLPYDYVIYAMGPLLIVKFLVAGCSSFLYLRQYVREYRWAYLGALFYTFSGYVFSDLFYNHFMDVIALFPFLLLALDQNVKNGKKWVFSIMVAIMATTNYVFFVMEVMFVIVYFLCKVIAKEYTLTIKKFINLTIESVLGFCSSAIIVLPSVLDLLGNPRSTVHFTSIKEMLFYALNQYILLMKAAFFPADLQNSASLYENRWTCTELYLPLVGMVFVISYIFHCKKKRNATFLMLIAFSLFSFIPVLNSSFQLFNRTYYTRWFFMFTLVLALASIKALEEKYEIVYSSAISVLIIVVLTVCFYKQNAINNKFYVWILVMALIGVLFVIVWKRYSNKYAFFVCGLMVFILLEGAGHFYNTFAYRELDDYFDNFVGMQARNHLKQDEFYRTENKTWNTSMVSENKDIFCWNSTVSASIFSFYNNVGVNRHITSSPDDGLYGLRALLSVKYIYNQDNEFLNTKVYSDDGIDLIYENLDYLPMGFAFEHYITEEEYQMIPIEKRHLVLLKALVLNDGDAENYQDCLEKLDKTELSHLDYDGFKKDLEERKKNVCNSFEQGKNSFSANIDLDEEKLIFISIPYEKGWKATVNDQPTEIVKVDDGLMAIKCQKGENVIQFTYVPEGFRIGMVVSIIAVLVILSGVVKDKYYQRKFMRR